MMAGRPPLGCELVERTEGSPEAKRRVQIVLRTLAGELTIPQACLELGIGHSRFHQMRSELLQQMVAVAEPRAPGRPATEPADVASEQLRQEVGALKMQLRAAQIREELAMILPHTIRRPDAATKKKRPTDRRR
jgi:hypothetical protein